MTTQPISPDPNGPDPNRRHSGRVTPYWLNADPGYVLDISETGIRLLAKKTLKGEITLSIWTEEIGLHLQAEVVWSKKIGFRQFEVGLRWIDLDEENLARLREIALEHEEKKVTRTENAAVAAAEPSQPPPGPDPTEDPRLRRLMESWSSLPDAVKVGIIAMADAAHGRAA